MIKLKPQIFLKLIDESPTLIDEHQYVTERQEHAALLQRLVDGVDEDTLTDEEFEQIEYLNNKGYLSIIDDPEAPAWELVGVPYSTLINQRKHLSFSVDDKTSNGLGEDVGQRLVRFGFARDEESPRLILAFSDTYLNLPEETSKTPFLPIVCNRMKLWLGPIQFEWSSSVIKKVKSNSLYIDNSRYKLPAVYDELQRAWIAGALSQMIARSQLRYVGCLYEYDMTRMRGRIIGLT